MSSMLWVFFDRTFLDNSILLCGSEFNNAAMKFDYGYKNLVFDTDVQLCELQVFKCRGIFVKKRVK